MSYIVFQHTNQIFFYKCAAFFLTSPIIALGCVTDRCVMMESSSQTSMLVCPLGTVSQQVTEEVCQPHHLLKAHTQQCNSLSQDRCAH